MIYEINDPRPPVRLKTSGFTVGWCGAIYFTHNGNQRLKPMTKIDQNGRAYDWNAIIIYYYWIWTDSEYILFEDNRFVINVMGDKLCLFYRIFSTRINKSLKLSLNKWRQLFCRTVLYLYTSRKYIYFISIHLYAVHVLNHSQTGATVWLHGKATHGNF